MGAPQGGMEAGSTRKCAGRVGRRVSQGGGAPSKWNPDEEIGARATERLTNWYLQVNVAPGVASQGVATMSKKPGKSAWAEQAQKQLKEQREKEMPGMLVAKQKATQDVKDGRAEKAAQRQVQRCERCDARTLPEGIHYLSI